MKTPNEEVADLTAAKADCLSISWKGWTVDLFIVFDGSPGITVDQPNPGMSPDPDAGIPFVDIIVAKDLKVVSDCVKRGMSEDDQADCLSFLNTAARSKLGWYFYHPIWRNGPPPGDPPKGWYLDGKYCPEGPPRWTWEESMEILRKDADTHWWNRSLKLE